MMDHPEVIDVEGESEGLIAQEARLVVALDYGTTFTGVGYATTFGNECPPLSKIGVNRVWGDGMNNQAKIASVISYSEPSQNREQQWGDSVAPNSITMVHTKLELDVKGVFEELDLTIQALDGMQNLRFQYIKGSQGQGGLPPYTYKSPEGIVTDYLTKMFVPASKGIDKFAERVKRDTATDIVVTIPTGWRYPAINATFRALTQAGFNRENFPGLREILFISEPEAASRYTVRHLKERQGDTFLKKNAYFILCDAGGGTVDVVSYKVKQVSPTLQLQQIGYPTGRKCGSIFINMEFKKWLKELLGDKNYAKIDPQMAADKITSHSTEGDAMRKLMAAFNEHKISFEGNTGQVFYMDLPYPLHNLDIDNRVDSGNFALTGADMEGFFKVCVGQIVELIKGHILQIEKKGGTPKNVFMVGGFGQSVYLHKRIEYSLSLRNIRLRWPENPWTAVVQGAVICGIEKLTTPNLRRASVCRHSYGIKLNTLFSDAYHNQRDIMKDTRGVTLAKGQLVWMLNKGDVCLFNEERKVEEDILLEFSATSDKRKQLPIYRYSEDDRPDRYHTAVEDLDEIANIAIDLNDIPLSQFDIVRGPGRTVQNMYKALVKLVLVLDDDRLRASVWWKDEEIPGTAVDNVPY